MDSELRQRKSTEGTSGESNNDDEATRAEYLRTAAEQTPEFMRPYVAAAAPFVAKGWVLFEKSIPIAQRLSVQAKEGYVKLQKYDVDALIPCIVGLAMAFFGGEFPLLIATVVAFRVTGSWDGCVKSVKMIMTEAQYAIEESRADDQKDDDGNGINDVNEISKTDLAKRKAILIAKSVDPDKLSSAFTALLSGVFAVVASLKLRFARTLTLGSAIGDLMTIPATRYGGPILKKAVDDEEFRQWVNPGIAYGCRMLCVSLAFVLHRLVESVHSAVQGGRMFSLALFKYLQKHKIMDVDPEKSHLDEMVGYGVALVGLYYQLFYAIPFLLSVLLLPFTFVEWLIKFAISFA